MAPEAPLMPTTRRRGAVMPAEGKRIDDRAAPSGDLRVGSRASRAWPWPAARDRRHGRRDRLVSSASGARGFVANRIDGASRRWRQFVCCATQAAVRSMAPFARSTLASLAAASLALLSVSVLPGGPGVGAAYAK